MEISARKSALNQSITDDLAYKKQKFHDMNDLEGKFDFLARNYWSVIIYEALCFDVAQGRLNGAPNEIRTHSCRFASQLECC